MNKIINGVKWLVLTALCVLLAGCGTMRQLLPIASKAGGSIACVQVDESEREMLRTDILPKLIEASGEERRAAFGSLVGTAAHAPIWFGAAWVALHESFQVTTKETWQAEYDAALDALIRGCAASLGIVADAGGSSSPMTRADAGDAPLCGGVS